MAGKLFIFKILCIVFNDSYVCKNIAENKKV